LPLLYLTDRSPIFDFDSRDYKRRLWTYEELIARAKIVESRTSRVMQIQESLIIHWYESAKIIQNFFRGYRARLEVARVRATLSEEETRRILGKCAVLTQLRRSGAARSIQRGYRCHRAYMILLGKAHKLLQKVIRLFLFRLHRRQASMTIQRAYGHMKSRQAVRKRLTLITAVIKKQQRQERLEQLARDYNAARKKREDSDRNVILRHDPVESLRLFRVKQRKKKILHSLQMSTKDVIIAKSNKNRNTS
jgi:hypothetical protein